MVPVQKQQGFNDCGLFAIANAVYLAKNKKQKKKHNPEKACFHQSHIYSTA